METETPAYVSQFTPELRDNPVWSEHKTISDLGKAYLSLQEKSNQAIYIPGENATPEEVSSFRAKMGIPGSPDEYETSIDDLPEAEAKQLESIFKKNAMDAGLTKTQAKKQWEMLTGVIKAGAQEQITKKNTFTSRLEDTLKKDYPGDAERKAALEETSNLYAAFLTRTGLSKQLEAAGLSYDTSFVTAVAADERSRTVKSKDGKLNSPPQPVGSMGSYSSDFMKFAEKHR